MADGPVSRILCRTQTAKRLACAAIIPLGHDSHRDSSSLPEGFQSTMACAAAEGAFAHRAGPALPSYLALHHAGFSVPPVSPRERWALTPPFHPCQTMRALRRRLAGFPARCHRAALRRRFIFCGTFRSASSGTGIPACPPGFAPWRYQARCPVKSSAPHKSEERASGRCPDFPPAPAL